MAGDLKQLLDHLLADAGPSERDWRTTIIKHWHELMGPVARYAVVERIDGDTLVIGVVSSVWMQELQAMSPILIKRVNQLAGGQHIGKVRFKFLSCSRHAKPNRARQQPVSDRPVERALNESERQALEHVSDSELSKALHSFLMRCYQVHRA